MPAKVPFRGIGNHLFLLGQLRELDPKPFENEPRHRDLLYHHLLQRGIVDLLAVKFRSSWQMDFVPLNLPGARGEFFRPIANATPSTILNARALDDLFRDNLFTKSRDRL